jgi:Uma2 family endonuclease
MGGMTALPRVRPPLTLADYLALGEDEDCAYELQEGELVMAPSPTPRHSYAMGELHVQLRAQLPPGLLALQDVDVDLQLVGPDGPATVRRPDLLVTSTDAYDRVGRDGGLLRASEVRLVVEIISPGSQRTDSRVKRDEYADAGIPHYWIVDLDPVPTLTPCHLAGEFGYQDGGAVTVSYEASEPAPVRIDLTALA